MKNNKRSQFFITREETIKWLDKYHIKNYTINDDLSVDVNGSVDISRKNLKFIPINFRNVTGSFWCGHNKLTTLTGSPKTVIGYFSCNYNELKNLNNSPESVGWYFACKNNQLTSLAGAPKLVEGYFDCRGNQLISLLEICDCNFKQRIYFNIDEKNFKQKELIQELKKYDKQTSSSSHTLILTKDEFNNIIKPQMQKEILEQKLKKPKTWNAQKTRNYIKRKRVLLKKSFI